MVYYINSCANLRYDMNNLNPLPAQVPPRLGPVRVLQRDGAAPQPVRGRPRRRVARLHRRVLARPPLHAARRLRLCLPLRTRTSQR